MKILDSDNRPFRLSFKLIAKVENADALITKEINKWQLNREYCENYSLMEFLSLNKKEYSKYVIGKWSAQKIIKRRDFYNRFWRLYYSTIDFFTPRYIYRKFKHLFQRIFKGYNDSETWDLGYTIAKFTLPRLKRFKELNEGYPCGGEIKTYKEWNEVLDKIIWSLEKIANDARDYPDLQKDLDNDCYSIEKEIEYNKKIQEGLDLFGKYFITLWW